MIKRFIRWFLIAGGLFLLIGTPVYFVLYLFANWTAPILGYMVIGGWAGGLIGCAIVYGVFGAIVGDL